MEKPPGSGPGAFLLYILHLLILITYLLFICSNFFLRSETVPEEEEEVFGKDGFLPVLWVTEPGEACLGGWVGGGVEGTFKGCKTLVGVWLTVEEGVLRTATVGGDFCMLSKIE